MSEDSPRTRRAAGQFIDAVDAAVAALERLKSARAGLALSLQDRAPLKLVRAQGKEGADDNEDE